MAPQNKLRSSERARPIGSAVGRQEAKTRAAKQRKNEAHGNLWEDEFNT
jgi:hypothetical protein